MPKNTLCMESQGHRGQRPKQRPASLVEETGLRRVSKPFAETGLFNRYRVFYVVPAPVALRRDLFGSANRFGKRSLNRSSSRSKCQFCVVWA